MQMALLQAQTDTYLTRINSSKLRVDGVHVPLLLVLVSSELEEFSQWIVNLEAILDVELLEQENGLRLELQLFSVELLDRRLASKHWETQGLTRLTG